MTTTLPEAGPVRPTRDPGWLRNAVGTQNLSLLVALVVLLAIFYSQRPDVFFTARNLTNIGLAITMLGILAMAQTIVIVSGGLDISVGAIVGVTSVAAALAVQATGSTSAGLGAALGAGLLLGLANGLIITVGRVNAVIATLGTMAAFRGLGLILTDGRSVSVQDEGFRALARPFLVLPVPIWILLAVLVVLFVFLRYTVMGRNVYAIGGNPVVARLAGIDLTRYRIGIYALSGVAAALAGIILVARTGSGHPISGSEGLELEAITAAVLGGAALAGGKGTIVGALLGVLILGTLTNGMTLTSVPSFYQMLAKGALLILAVVIQEYQLRRSGESS